MCSVFPLRCSFRSRVLLKTLHSPKVRQFSSNGPTIAIETLKFDIDHVPVTNFLQNVFRVSEPITRALQCTPSDTLQMFNNIYAKCSQYPDLSLVAKNDKGDVVTVLLNSFYESVQQKGNVNIADWSDKKEFGDEIRNGPYASRNANRLHFFLDWVEQNLALLPSGTLRRAIKLEIMSGHPDYARVGLGSKLLLNTIQMARSSHCSHVITCATAVASQNGLRKFGFKTIKKLPFDSFLDNGVPIFAGVHDSGEGAELMALTI